MCGDENGTIVDVTTVDSTIVGGHDGGVRG